MLHWVIAQMGSGVRGLGSGSPQPWTAGVYPEKPPSGTPKKKDQAIMLTAPRSNCAVFATKCCLTTTLRQTANHCWSL